MHLPKLVRGTFVRRDNRFRATVEIEGRETWAHVPNSGRLQELFRPGRPVWMAPANSSGRKTFYDLKLVETNSVLVSVDARLPNPLFAEALSAGNVPGYNYPTIDAEVSRGNSRLDFRLSGPEGACWVETKSVTLVQAGTALFPDAPTERGRKHLQELIAIQASGIRAAVIFVVQRPDAGRFSPFREADPEFSALLRQAAAAGVDVRAFRCLVLLEEIRISDELAVALD